MTEFPHASLCYLTEPTPGQPVINVQTPDGKLTTAISIALQNDVKPAELAHSVVRNPDGSPASPIGYVVDDMVMG